MGHRPNNELPGRAEVVARFDRSIQQVQLRQPELLEHGRDIDARPAVCVIAVDGYAELVDLDPAGAADALDELSGRLDHLVRAEDLLGRLEPGSLVLAATSLAPAVAGSLVDRVAGAVAMPVEVAGQVLSLEVTVGLAFAKPGDDASSIIARGEEDVARIRSRR